MEHSLVIEHHNGCYRAFCSCGGWVEAPLGIKMGRLRDIFSRLEAAHRRHLEQDGDGVSQRAPLPSHRPDTTSTGWDSPG